MSSRLKIYKYCVNPVLRVLSLGHPQLNCYLWYGTLLDEKQDPWRGRVKGPLFWGLLNNKKKESFDMTPVDDVITDHLTPDCRSITIIDFGSGILFYTEHNKYAYIHIYIGMQYHNGTIKNARKLL